MREHKSLWIVVGAVVVLTVVFSGLFVKNRLSSTSSETPSTTAATTAKTSAKPTKNPASTSTTTKNRAEMKPAPTAEKPAIPDESDCRSLGIGGGQFYYAVGYKNGDEGLADLVEYALRQKEDTVKQIADKWFYGTVYPRDTAYAMKGAVDDARLTALKKDGVTVGVFDGNAPVASFENGKAVGFEIEVAKAVFGVYGLTPRFVAVTEDTAADKLKDGSVTLLWGGLRDEQLRGISYSAPNVWNLENELCYYVPVTARYKGETELLEKTEKMAVVQGSLCAQFVTDRLKSAGYDTAFSDYAVPRDAFAALKHGDVTCVACDYLSAYAMWRQD